jgi:hypothetical protein
MRRAAFRVSLFSKINPVLAQGGVFVFRPPQSKWGYEISRRGKIW